MKLAQKLLKTISLSYSKIIRQIQNIIDTTSAAVAKLISALDTKKSLGPKLVPTFILKSNIHLFSQVISFIVNQSFHEEVFPQSIKTSKVII